MGTLRRMLTAAARALPARPARPAISDARSPPARRPPQEPGSTFIPDTAGAMGRIMHIEPAGRRLHLSRRLSADRDGGPGPGAGPVPG